MFVKLIIITMLTSLAMVDEASENYKANEMAKQGKWSTYPPSDGKFFYVDTNTNYIHDNANIHYLNADILATVDQFIWTTTDSFTWTTDLNVVESNSSQIKDYN